MPDRIDHRECQNPRQEATLWAGTYCPVIDLAPATPLQDAQEDLGDLAA